MADRLTLGIEEEFQLVDPATRALKSHIEEMLAAGAHLGDQIKPELHRSVVEVGTPVCADIGEARVAVKHLRRSLVEMAAKSGVAIVAAGTHPFSHWKDQEITERDRYTEIVNEMEDLARANLIFGLHVHVGIEDREMQILIMNAVRGFLPHLLALSVNSPFWCGRKTGVKSVRSTIFTRFPRTQIPDYFRSWHEYEKLVDLLVRTHCIDDAKKIWWDVRPHAFFPTLEYRICDVPLRPIYHMSSFLSTDTPVFDIRKKFGCTDMLVREPEQGAALAGTLGNGRVALMRGHGFVTAGDTLPIVVFQAIYTTLNASLLCQAISLGGEITYLESDEAELAWETNRASVSKPWEVWTRNALRRAGEPTGGARR